jgi:hypothetical protein
MGKIAGDGDIAVVPSVAASRAEALEQLSLAIGLGIVLAARV